MLKRSSVVVLALLASLALACSDRLSVRVDTEGTVFDRVPTTGSTVPVAVIPYVATNTGDKVAFLPACGANPSVAIERFDAGQWQQWSVARCIAIMPMTPIEMRSGNRARGSVSILEAGHFRVRLDYADNGSMQNANAAYSEPFDVR